MTTCSCSRNKNGAEIIGTISISSPDVDCSKQENHVQVPSMEGTYHFDIKTGENIEWSVTLEQISQNKWLTVETTGIQRGSKRIAIEAEVAAKAGNTLSNTGTLDITSASHRHTIRLYSHRTLVILRRRNLCPPSLQDKQFYGSVPKSAYRINSLCNFKCTNFLLCFP